MKYEGGRMKTCFQPLSLSGGRIFHFGFERGEGAIGRRGADERAYNVFEHEGH
jgi:hypothetical protein